MYTLVYTFYYIVMDKGMYIHNIIYIYLKIILFHGVINTYIKNNIENNYLNNVM